MNTIGILGTGRMGIRLALMFAETGRRVILGSRDIRRSARIVQELGREEITSGTYTEAATAEFVLPAAFFRDGLLDTLEPLRHQLDDKVYIRPLQSVQP